MASTGKLLLILVAAVAVIAVTAVALQGGLPGSASSSCKPLEAPAGAIAWVDTSVHFERSGGDWVGTIEQTEVESIDTYTPHCKPALEDRLQDSGSATLGTWTLTGQIKTTDQERGASSISAFSVAGIRLQHGASNLAGEFVIHAPPTFFMLHTHYRTTALVSLEFDNGIMADEETDLVNVYVEGSS